MSRDPSVIHRFFIESYAGKRNFVFARVHTAAAGTDAAIEHQAVYARAEPDELLLITVIHGFRALAFLFFSFAWQK